LGWYFNAQIWRLASCSRSCLRTLANPARSRIAPSAWPGKCGCPQRFPRTVPTPKQLSLKPGMGTVSSPILSQSKAMAEPQSAGEGKLSGVPIRQLAFHRPPARDSAGSPKAYSCSSLLQKLDTDGSVRSGCSYSSFGERRLRLKDPVAELRTGNGAVVVVCLVFRLFCLV
jgi:hypothetical protein